MMNDFSYSQKPLSTIILQSDSEQVENLACDTNSAANDVGLDSVLFSEDQSDRLPEEESESLIVGKRTLWATISDAIATFLGIVAAIITLIWMHYN